jgi:Putative cyclase
MQGRLSMRTARAETDGDPENVAPHERQGPYETRADRRLCGRRAGCASPVALLPPGPSDTPVDLSHDYSDQTVFWAAAEAFKLEMVADGVTEQGYAYAANDFASSEHGGTHIDAPGHLATGHWFGRPVDRSPPGSGSTRMRSDRQGS